MFYLHVLYDIDSRGSGSPETVSQGVENSERQEVVDTTQAAVEAVGVEVATTQETTALQEQITLSQSIDITSSTGPAGAMIEQIDTISGVEGQGVEMMKQYEAFRGQYLGMFLPWLDEQQKQGMQTALATILMRTAMTQEQVGNFLETLDRDGGGKALLFQAIGLGSNLGDYPDLVLRLSAMMRLISDMKQSHTHKSYSSMMTNPVAMIDRYDTHIDGKKPKDLRALIAPTKDGTRQAGYTTIASALYQEDQALTSANAPAVTARLEEVFEDLSGQYGETQHSEFTAMLTAGPLGLDMIEEKRQTLLEKSGVISRLCDLPGVGPMIQQRLAPLFDLYGGYEGYTDLVAGTFTSLSDDDQKIYESLIQEYTNADITKSEDYAFISDYTAKIGVTRQESDQLSAFSRSKFSASIGSLPKKSMGKTTTYGSHTLPVSTWKLLGPDYIMDGKTLTDTRGIIESDHAGLAKQYALSSAISILLQNKPLISKIKSSEKLNQDTDLISQLMHLYLISPQLQNYVIQHSHTAKTIEQDDAAREVIEDIQEDYREQNEDVVVDEEQVRRTHRESNEGHHRSNLPGGFTGSTEGVNSCSLNTRETLHQHTGLPFSGDQFTSGMIPQGHAIDLIYAGKQQNMLYPLFESGQDWNERIDDLTTYLNMRYEQSGHTILDVYIESPWKSGVHQGHRFVVALTDQGRQVYDPSRDGSWSQGSVAHDLRWYFERNTMHYPVGSDGGREAKFYISKIGYSPSYAGT